MDAALAESDASNSCGGHDEHRWRSSQGGVHIHLFIRIRRVVFR